MIPTAKSILAVAGQQLPPTAIFLAPGVPRLERPAGERRLQAEVQGLVLPGLVVLRADGKPPLEILPQVLPEGRIVA